MLLVKDGHLTVVRVETEHMRVDIFTNIIPTSKLAHEISTAQIFGSLSNKQPVAQSIMEEQYKIKIFLSQIDGYGNLSSRKTTILFDTWREVDKSQCISGNTINILQLTE